MTALQLISPATDAPPQRLAQGSLIPFLTALQTTPFVHLVLAEPEQIGTRISTDLTRLSLVHPLSSRTYYVGKRVTGVNPEIEDNLIHVTCALLARTRGKLKRC